MLTTGYSCNSYFLLISTRIMERKYQCELGTMAWGILALSIMAFGILALGIMALGKLSFNRRVFQIFIAPSSKLLFQIFPLHVSIKLIALAWINLFKSV